ncbi:MAG: hypothetical protein ACI959_001443, partial [Limisphaerales bacterium]
MVDNPIFSFSLFRYLCRLWLPAAKLLAEKLYYRTTYGV